MKFIIENSNDIGQQELLYLFDEYSFYMPKVTDKTDIELVVNKICLFVASNRVIDLSGFCGLNKSMKSNYKVPEFKKGILRVKHNLKYGFAYRINDEDWPVYVNTQTGWVCIGDPEKKGNAVEFIKNCVAVIGYDNEFVSLWLKPQILSNFENKKPMDIEAVL